MQIEIIFDTEKAMWLMVFASISRGLSAQGKIEGGGLNIPDRIDTIIIGILS